ncbi:MAG: transposase [Balneolaceae bacterium]|nr:transposase [Balneolaceae bacterium]
MRKGFRFYWGEVAGRELLFIYPEDKEILPPKQLQIQVEKIEELYRDNAVLDSAGSSAAGNRMVDVYVKRNHIEGHIGNAKQALSMNQIKAKLKGTSKTWIAATLFVLNISAFAARSGVTF